MNLDTPTIFATSDHSPMALASCGYLSFQLGAEENGIDNLMAQENRSYEPPTGIDGTPAFNKDVVNLRGVIVPIVELRLKFGLDRVDYDDATVVIGLNAVNHVLGIVVDGVSDVIEFTLEQVRAAPSFNTVVDAGHITGIGVLGQGDTERLLILTDIGQPMGSPEMGFVHLDLALP